jgi:hypothetical protein
MTGGRVADCDGLGFLSDGGLVAGILKHHRLLLETDVQLKEVKKNTF